MGNATSKDGPVTKFCEKLPIVGYGVAAVQAISGNADHAKRALATSTGSLLTTAGAVGGFCVGGPVGAVAGAAVASQAGIAAEWGISKTINDQDVRGNVGDVTVGRCVGEALLAGATAPIGGAGAVAGKTAGTVTKALVTGGVTAVGQATTKTQKDSLDNKPKRRIVTVGQQTAAGVLNTYIVQCRDHFHGEPPIGDMLGNLGNSSQFIVAGQDWIMAYGFWTEGRAYYNERRPGAEGRLVQSLRNAGHITPDTTDQGMAETITIALGIIEEKITELESKMVTEVAYVDL